MHKVYLSLCRRSLGVVTCSEVTLIASCGLKWHTRTCLPGLRERAECSAMQTTQQTRIAVAASANAAGVHAVVVVVAGGATAAAAAESIAAARGATSTYEFTTQPATTN